MKLLRIERSSNPSKKWTAVFENNGHTISTSFGARGMDDYTITHNAEQRERYLKRHTKDLMTHDVTRAGYLSYYILWGPHTSMQENVAYFKQKFNL